MKAIWNEVVIADSNQTIEANGNHYFPPNTVKKEYLEESQTHTNNRDDKGEAAYYHVKVHGQVNPDAAWYYPNPKDTAKDVKDYITFGKGITVKE